MIPYGRQSVSKEDIEAVIDALQSDWLTTGPRVAAFERAFAEFVGAPHAVAVASGTAALHAAMFALGLGPGDEVIVPTLTFAATANAVAYVGATPVFADVDAETLLIDPGSVERCLSPCTRAIVAVDYAGQPCDYASLREIADRRKLALIADASHAPGARYRGEPVGTLADLTTFSFHPVKHLTTGEGGMVTGSREDLVERMRSFRNHGITSDHHQRAQEGSWFYEMTELGWNYRISDFQCALGRSQLQRLPEWLERRREIASRYDAAFADSRPISPLAVRADVEHAYHLYVARFDWARIGRSRAEVFTALRDAGVGVNVHYVPVHLHPYYQRRYGTRRGMCPIAEQAYEQILSLPIFPTMTDDDIETVIRTVLRVTQPLMSGAASARADAAPHELPV